MKDLRATTRGTVTHIEVVNTQIRIVLSDGKKHTSFFVSDGLTELLGETPQEIHSSLITEINAGDYIDVRFDIDAGVLKIVGWYHVNEAHRDTGDEDESDTDIA